MSARALLYDIVQLADNEWGNGIMQEIAAEWFAAHPDCDFVEVREHAGWWLGYHRGDLAIIATANDQAVLPAGRPRAERFSGLFHRRETLRPELREITTLEQYRYA